MIRRYKMAKSKQYEKLTELQVELMTEWMARFVAQIAKVLPDDVTAKLSFSKKKKARLPVYCTIRCGRIRSWRFG